MPQRGCNPRCSYLFFILRDKHPPFLLFHGHFQVFRYYEAPHTNHICFPEGWVWVIRLPSWQGSPIPNLLDMIHYLLDHAEAATANDEMPSVSYPTCLKSQRSLQQLYYRRPTSLPRCLAARSDGSTLLGMLCATTSSTPTSRHSATARQNAGSTTLSASTPRSRS